MKRFDWYILRELGGPFLFGVTAFTSIMIGSNLLFKLANYIIELDMPLPLVGKIFLLELPGIIVFTFPMATLLSALLAFGRLSGNSEIIAFKAGGISFARLMLPVILLGVFASSLTIYVNEEIVPYTSYQTRKTAWEFTYKAKYPSTQKYLNMTPIDRKTGWPEYILYAESFNSETSTLSNVLFQDFDGKRLTAMFEAEEARWLNNQWIFFTGSTYIFALGDQPVVKGRFSEYEMKVLNRTPQQIVMGSKNMDEMSADELKQMIALYRQEGKKTNKLAVKYYQHFAVPFACLIFAFFGAPLGLQPNRSGSSIGLGLSIIVIFIYYVVLTAAGALGQAGAISPWLGAWLPNIIFGLAGVTLIAKASR